MKLTATKLRDCWAIRPKGRIGMSGWVDGVPWTVRFVKQLPYGMEIENA